MIAGFIWGLILASSWWGGVMFMDHNENPSLAPAVIFTTATCIFIFYCILDHWDD